MNFLETNIKGVYEVHFFNATDDRGSFVKTFHCDSLREAGLNAEFQESFYSTNKQGVIRGMHFQVPPEDHAKLVYATQGTILDVILDLRRDSETYGQFAQVEISGSNFCGVYMPKGVAHGFCCLTEATMVYLTSTQHSPQHDSGIRWDSFGMDWPVVNPIISARDQGFEIFSQLESPF